MVANFTYFYYRALFACCDLFHALMTSFHNAITGGGGVHTTEMQSNSSSAKEQNLQVADKARCILSSQMTPNWKTCGPAVYERQIMSALVVGYIHSHSRPSVANVQLPPQPTCGWLVNRLALLTISYHSPHLHFRDRGINLPDEVQCSPYSRVATSVMDGPYLVEVVLAWRHRTCIVWKLNCLLEEIKPSL